MKRKISIFLAALLVMATFSTAALAADTETVTVNGFYNIGTADDVSTTPYQGTTQISATQQDIDGDEVEDAFYANSERVEVTYSAAVEDRYYGTILVEGDGSTLPTKDDKIYYIDQVTAQSSDVEFNVYPILPTETTDLTLYITSDVEEFDLVSIPMSYAVGTEMEAPTYILGDIDGTEEVDIDDAIALFQYSMFPDVYPIDYAGSVDFDKNGDVDIDDAILLFQYSMFPDVYPLQ